jgi:hypothetical protein
LNVDSNARRMHPPGRKQEPNIKRKKKKKKAPQPSANPKPGPKDPSAN